MKPPIPICFDLDHTLLDTLQIRKDIYSLARPYGLHTTQLIQAYRGAVGNRFTPHKFVAGLGLTKIDGKELLKKILLLLGTTRRFYVYPGIPNLLSHLSKRTPLYLVTHGDPNYQRIKFQESGLAHYFSRVIVTPDITKEKILRKLFIEVHGKILMIDDSRRVHESALRIGFPIIKVRKSYKDSAYIEDLRRKILKKIDELLD